MDYTPEQINEISSALLRAGYRMASHGNDGYAKGWVIIPGHPRYGVRLGDPKPLPMAVISAYEYRQYISGYTCTTEG